MHVVAYSSPDQALDELARRGGETTLLVPVGAYRIDAGFDAVSDRLGWFDAAVVVGAGDALTAAGPADELARLLAGETVEAEVDEGRLLFHVLGADAVDDTDLLEVDGRLVHLPTGGEPIVLIGPPERLMNAGGRTDAAAERWRLTLSIPPESVGAMDQPAPELLTATFWSPQRCAALVALAAASEAWAADPEDPVPGSEIPLVALSPALLAALEAEVDERLVPALRDHWPTFAWCGLDDAFVIRTGAAAATGVALPLHHDIAQISASVVLSADHEGGGLEFPRQSWSTAGLRVGQLVAWPSLVTHPHRGLPVTSGVRYGLTLWFSLPA